MSDEEWEASPAFPLCVPPPRYPPRRRGAGAGRRPGRRHLHVKATDRGFGPGDLAIADAGADVIGSTVERIEAHGQVERERDEALRAREVTGTAVAIADPRSADVGLNAAARRLLDDVAEADERLNSMLARPAPGGGFARGIDVELATGERAAMHGHAIPLPEADGGIVVVLEREQRWLCPALHGMLTAREREVAALVVDGLADREIAERLYLGHHTVSQHVKRIHRRLGVDARVALTRALLGRR
jgi:DNA-binding CsgD family transcriptional regulator